MRSRAKRLTSRRSGSPRLGVVATAIVLMVGACGDDGTVSDANRFCGEAAAQRDLIVSPPLATEAELVATLDFYRLMGELAPIGIAAEWNDLVIALETASALIPGDPASEQLVAMTAYATERSAYTVKVWLNQNCAVDIPITTIAPQDPIPAQTVPAATAPTDTVAGEPNDSNDE